MNNFVDSSCSTCRRCRTWGACARAGRPRRAKPRRRCRGLEKLRKIADAKLGDSSLIFQNYDYCFISERAQGRRSHLVAAVTWRGMWRGDFAENGRSQGHLTSYNQALSFLAVAGSASEISVRRPRFVSSESMIKGQPDRSRVPCDFTYKSRA